MAFGVGLADTAKLVVDLSLKGNFSSSLSKATRDLKTFESRIDHTKSKANQIGQHIGLGLRNIIKVGAVASATIGGLAVATLKLAGDFQAQLNTINTIAQTTPAGLTKIGDSIRQLARDTGTSLEDLTSGYYDLLSAGIKTADAQQVLVNANKLAIGGLATTAQTVDLLTTAINAYGGDAKKATYYTDLFAKAIELGKVTADQIASSFANIAPVAATNGIEIREVTAAYAALTAQGVPAAEVTTQMSRAILDLLSPNKALNKLQKETGQNFYKLAKNKGLVVALQAMRDAVGDDDEAFKSLFGRVEGYKFALQTTGKQQKIYNDALAAMDKAAGTANKQFAERAQGLNFQLSRFKILIKDAGIQIGTKLLPKITPLIEQLNDFIGGKEGQSFISQIGDDLAGLFTKENIQQGIDAIKSGFTIAKEAAPVIAGAAKITQQALKIAVDLFNSLPPEIQKLAVAGLAINKITGGLVTNLAGGLISAVLSSFKGVLGVNAGVVNVNGAVVNGPGGVPGVPAGGGGGGGGLIPLLKSLILPVTIAAITVEAAGALARAIDPTANQPGSTPLANRDPRRFDQFGRVIQNSVQTGAKQGTEKGIKLLDTFDRTKPGAEGGSNRGSNEPLQDTFDRRNIVQPLSDSFDRAIVPTTRAINDTKASIDTLPDSFDRAVLPTTLATSAVQSQISSGLEPKVTSVQYAAQGAGNAVVSAIARKNLEVNQSIKVNVNVSAAGVTKSVTIQNRYGPGNGSAGSDAQRDYGAPGHPGR